jgi:DNA-directed RNA polymerase
MQHHVDDLKIADQIRLEREQIACGINKLHDNVKKLEDKSYASASVYGVSSMKALLPRVIERIEKTFNRINEGYTGRDFKEIHQYISNLEPLAIATIAAKVTFDRVFSSKPKANLLVDVCAAIGQAIESECQMRHYERCAPGLLNDIKKRYWHASCGTEQRLTVVRTMMNRHEVERWDAWGRANRVKLGGWLLDAIAESSRWFEKSTTQEGKKKTNYLVPTAEFMAVKDQVMRDAELFAPIAWPMLVPPNNWSNERAGGYILNEVMHGYDLVRRGGPCIQGKAPIDFLNKIQRVAYTLNPFIVEVAETLQERQTQVGKFVPIVSLDLPPKPVDIAENYEARKDYRRRAAETMNKNAHAFKRSCRTRMTMEAVARFKNVDRFYVPWSFDYRGRAYPIPSFLTPQDTDFGKSLLRFADESYMTHEAEDWLRFQCATTYGLDKAPMSERLAWAHENEELIKRIAKDPINCLPEWEVADEPWQFLAACDELYHCVLIADRQFTGLPVATDATCSGLQILAGLARDKSTAQLVNVLPGDRPQDAYKVVAETAKPHCPESIQPYMDRKTVKRVVMTVPYNAKPYSNRGYIREALKEKEVEISKEDLTATVKAVRNAMDVVVPGPMAVMSWIESEVSNAIKNGAEHLEWVTPSGFVVHQRLDKYEADIIKLQLMGQARCKLSVRRESDSKVDINHHKNATAPNLIHSLDASLLHLSTLRFDAPIALIHDSVLCRATDMSVLSTLVRETYMHLFAEHDYLRDFARQIGAESEPPIIGDLEPESVIESTYFFC